MSGERSVLFSQIQELAAPSGVMRSTFLQRRNCIKLCFMDESVHDKLLTETNGRPAEAGPEAISQLLDDWLKREVFRRTLALASAAHELKTPLAVMSGYTDLLLGERLGPLTEGQRNVPFTSRDGTELANTFQ